MEEIIRLQQYEPLWEEWSVDKLLCEGNLSSVYQVKNEKTIGVIKVIPIPKLQTEGRMATQASQGNRDTMDGFFKEVVDVLSEELERISVLNDIPNVLGYQKYEAFERREDIGYDLVLLMDKEQNLIEYVSEHDITNEDIVRIIREISWILDKAHDEGIIHKDIRVENIFMAENGESMLADFAIARKVESYQSRNQRKMDNTYLAPEVMSEYDYSVETDIYALGMVMYLLLNDGKIPPALLKRTFKTEVPQPVRAQGKLTEIVLKAISYRPEQRYRSAKELFNELNALTEQDFELPEDYLLEEDEKLRRAEDERLRKEAERKAEEERLRREAERKAEEERLRREAEERKAEEERLRREAERKAEEERLRREEEERKAEEERLRREAERKAEEERLRREEERKAEEERLRREAERKAEEERLRREEEERKAEEERLRREAERKAKEQQEKELLRQQAEQSIRKASQEQSKKQNEDVGHFAPTQMHTFLEEETLDGAMEELNNSIQRMNEAQMHVKKDVAESQKKSGYAEPKIRESYDRDSEPAKEFTDYSSQGQRDRGEVAYNNSVTDDRNRNATKTLQNKEKKDDFVRIEEEDTTVYKLHSDASVYSGFFDFTKETYQEQQEKEKDKLYDKSVELEPFVQQVAVVEKEKRSVKPLLVACAVLLIVGAGFFSFQNESTRNIIEDTYTKLKEYVDEHLNNVVTANGTPQEYQTEN